MNLRTRVEHWSVRWLTRLACVLALVGLAVMCFSVIVPRPLPVIFAMSGGQAIGIAAFTCYLVAVLLDLARREGDLPLHVSSAPDAAPPTSRGAR
jgi:hypothetical protein